MAGAATQSVVAAAGLETLVVVEAMRSGWSRTSLLLRWLGCWNSNEIPCCASFSRVHEAKMAAPKARVVKVFLFMSLNDLWRKDIKHFDLFAITTNSISVF